MAAENEVLAASAALDGVLENLEVLLARRVTELRAAIANYRKGLAKVVDAGMSGATFQNTYQDPMDETTQEIASFGAEINADMNYYGSRIIQALP